MTATTAPARDAFMHVSTAGGISVIAPADTAMGMALDWSEFDTVMVRPLTDDEFAGIAATLALI